jgi:putative transposase
VWELCELFEVQRSSYYLWKSKVLERRTNEEKEKELALVVERVFLESRKSYGAIRVHDKLRKEGISDYSVKQVRRIMKKKRLFSVHCKAKKKVVITTDSKGNKSIADNLLKRDFRAVAPNEKWVGDISFIATGEGWLYLATVIDLFSRKIVGYSMSSKIDARLACRAFKMALMRRKNIKQLIYHSDRGSVYGSIAFRQLLLNNKISPSMSRKADCYDNAVAESFFHTLKVELTSQHKYSSRAEAQASISDWIENFYNSKRSHSSLGYCSPNEFEELFSNS